VQLTSESADVYWDSFIGHQLRRNKEEVQQLNRIYKSRYNAQLQLQVNPSQLSSLNSKAPVPITTISELIAFIKRVWHCSNLFFPYCAIGSLAQDLYKALLQQRRQLETDDDWLSKKPGEIVHYLWQEADREFSHVIPQQELLMGDLTGAYQHPPTANIIAQCLNPNTTIAQSFLPIALHQRTPLLPSPTPAATPQGTPGTGNHTGTGGRGGGPARCGGATGGRGTNRTQSNTQGTEEPVTNPQLHPLFWAFWSGVPPARQNDPLGRWLATSSTSTTRVLGLLNLASDACGQFHIRGICNRGDTCRNKHVPSPLDPRKVEQVVTLLQTGLQQAR
jgi:hypothetical protein